MLIKYTDKQKELLKNLFRKEKVNIRTNPFKKDFQLKIGNQEIIVDKETLKLAYYFSNQKHKLDNIIKSDKRNEKYKALLKLWSMNNLPNIILEKSKSLQEKEKIKLEKRLELEETKYKDILLNIEESLIKNDKSILKDLIKLNFKVNEEIQRRYKYYSNFKESLKTRIYSNHDIDILPISNKLKKELQDLKDKNLYVNFNNLKQGLEKDNIEDNVLKKLNEGLYISKTDLNNLLKRKKSSLSKSTLEELQKIIKEYNNFNIEIDKQKKSLLIKLRKELTNLDEFIKENQNFRLSLRIKSMIGSLTNYLKIKIKDLSNIEEDMEQTIYFNDLEFFKEIKKNISSKKDSTLNIYNLLYNLNQDLFNGKENFIKNQILKNIINDKNNLVVYKDINVSEINSKRKEKLYENSENYLTFLYQELLNLDKNPRKNKKEILQLKEKINKVVEDDKKIYKHLENLLNNSINQIKNQILKLEEVKFKEGYIGGLKKGLIINEINSYYEPIDFYDNEGEQKVPDITSKYGLFNEIEYRHVGYIPKGWQIKVKNNLINLLSPIIHKTKFQEKVRKNNNLIKTINNIQLLSKDLKDLSYIDKYKIKEELKNIFSSNEELYIII